MDIFNSSFQAWLSLSITNDEVWRRNRADEPRLV